MKDVIPAPQWLIDRMEAIKKLPSVTSEQAERQFRASAEQNLPQWLKKRKTTNDRVK